MIGMHTNASVGLRRETKIYSDTWRKELELPRLEPLGVYLLDITGERHELVFQPECGEKEVLMSKVGTLGESEKIIWHDAALRDLSRREKAYKLTLR